MTTGITEQERLRDIAREAADAATRLMKEILQLRKKVTAAEQRAVEAERRAEELALVVASGPASGREVLEMMQEARARAEAAERQLSEVREKLAAYTNVASNDMNDIVQLGLAMEEVKAERDTLALQVAGLREALKNCGRYFSEHDRDEEDADMLDVVRQALSASPAPSAAAVVHPDDMLVPVGRVPQGWFWSISRTYDDDGENWFTVKLRNSFEDLECGEDYTSFVGRGSCPKRALQKAIAAADPTSALPAGRE